MKQIDRLLLLLLQAHQATMLMDEDNHPLTERYRHLTYYIAERIEKLMEPKFSQFYNVMAKRDKMEAVLLSIRDDAGSLEDARQWAGDVLDEVGSTSPVMPKGQIPLPAPEADKKLAELSKKHVNLFPE
jgi:hypothetical protein